MKIDYAKRPWVKNYPKSVESEVSPDQYSSIVQLFEESIKKFQDRTAYINMGASITFNDLDIQSRNFASFLQNQGLKKGDRIALQMPNILQYPIALFGALRAGLIVVNTNPLYTPREMSHQFKDSGAKAIVIVANFACHLQDIIKDTDIKTVVVTEIGDLMGFPKSLIVNFVLKYVKKMVPSFHLPQKISFREALKIGSQKRPDPVSLKNSDIAFLQYTGGTTGVSKGAVLTHRNIIANMQQISEWMKPLLKENSETIITALPLYHIFSLTLNCLSFMKIGGTNLLVTNPKDIPAFIELLKNQNYTVFAGVNTLFNALMNHPEFNSINFSKLKISVAGAMALQKVVAERWMKLTKTPVVEGYGLTEASPVICCNPIDGTDRVGTIGMPVPSTDIMLLGEDGKEADVGELCAKGPQVMQGYWQRPDETEKVIFNGGWLRTGDIAARDKDGFFKIVDRKKDMILVSGFNVYPNEIEDVVSMHPAVLEVAAIGVPDEHSGEVVKIFVVKKALITEDELLEHCRKNLVGYKIPKHIEFIKELPKTNVGKILRRALREVGT